MNISPSDTDVRQGYALAENAQGVVAAAAPQTEAEQKAPVEQAAGKLANAEDERSLAAAASADRTSAKEAAQKLQEQLNNAETGLKIRVLDDSKSSVQVEIVDEKSNKVLRKIPQDELLKLSASIKEMSGVLVDRPA